MEYWHVVPNRQRQAYACDGKSLPADLDHAHMHPAVTKHIDKYTQQFDSGPGDAGWFPKYSTPSILTANRRTSNSKHTTAIAF